MNVSRDIAGMGYTGDFRGAHRRKHEVVKRGPGNGGARDRVENACKCMLSSMLGGQCFSLGIRYRTVWCFNVDWTTADSAGVRLPRLLFPNAPAAVEREFSKFCTAYIHVLGHT